MTLKEVENWVLQISKALNEHLIASTGITTRLSNIEDRLNWIFGLIALVFAALLGVVITRK